MMCDDDVCVGEGPDIDSLLTTQWLDWEENKKAASR